MADTKIFQAGERLDVLFLHATGFNAETYRPMLALLPAEVTWAAWDLRGHGANPLQADPAQLHSWQVYADDVIAVLDARRVTQTVLAGHSLGAVVAMLVAAARPDLVRALVLIDPPMVPPRYHFYARLPGGTRLFRKIIPIARTAGRRRAHFADLEMVRRAYSGRGAFRTWRPDFLDAYLRGGVRPAPGGGIMLCCTPAWEQATFAAFRHNAWAALKRVSCPLHLMVGEKHSTVQHQLARFRRCAPHATIEICAGTTHFVPMEVPEQVVSRIIAAVDSKG